MKKLNHWIHSVVDRKLLKFVAVGIVNTVVGTAIMFGLYNLAGCSYWVSSATNYTLTSILSFFLNKFFTFQNRQKSPAQVLRFAGNILVCYLVAYGAAKPAVLWALAGSRKDVAGEPGYGGGDVLVHRAELPGPAALRLFRQAQAGAGKGGERRLP